MFLGILYPPFFTLFMSSILGGRFFLAKIALRTISKRNGFDNKITLEFNQRKNKGLAFSKIILEMIFSFPHIKDGFRELFQQVLQAGK